VRAAAVIPDAGAVPAGSRALCRPTAAPRPARLYDMAAAFMQFQRHERGIRSSKGSARRVPLWLTRFLCLPQPVTWPSKSL